MPSKIVSTPLEILLLAVVAAVVYYVMFYVSTLLEIVHGAVLLVVDMVLQR